ncbi:HAD family hydrolase [Uniformispora flossi]|uniref:HAD family hydrolase n=1 Tax=Uniformispora flossi TaxID=3390723 RepID=UPI003C2CD6E5
MHAIRALAIDFSGTLARPGPNPDGACVADALRDRLGLDVPDDFAAVFDSVHAEIRQTDRDAQVHTMFSAVIARAALRCGADVPDAAEAAEAVFASLPDAAVDADAASTVRALHRQGWRCVLACNTERSAAARLRTLAEAGIADCFASAVLSSEIGFRKPHPEFYAVVARACAVPADQILFVGDNLSKDVLGPRAYGMHTVHVTRDGVRGVDGPPVDDGRGDGSACGVLGHFAELPGYLAATVVLPG